MKNFLFLRSTVSAIAFGYAMAAAPVGLSYDHGQLSFISVAHADDGGSDSSGSGGSGESDSDSGSDDSGHDSGSDDGDSHDSNDDSSDDDSSGHHSSSSSSSSSDDSTEHADPLTKALNKMFSQ
jgi:hypothetical protein